MRDSNIKLFLDQAVQAHYLNAERIKEVLEFLKDSSNINDIGFDEIFFEKINSEKIKVKFLNDSEICSKQEIIDCLKLVATVETKFAWIFNQADSKFSGGVFSSIETAEEWILKNKLTGILTKYPMDISVYDWAIENNFYKLKDENVKSDFIGGFTSASQEHYHYEEGKRD